MVTEAETPSDKLAAQAFGRLVERGLLRAERKSQLVEKIASGKMTAEDWRLELDLARAKAAEHKADEA